MHSMFLRAWWIFAIRGVAAILFGLMALLSPGITVLAMVLLFSAYALATGIVCTVGAMRSRKSDGDWWQLLAIGLAGIVAGLIAIVHPALTALVLLLLIAANALVTGVLDISAAVRLRRVIRNEWLLALSGAASILFGILIFLFPAAGGLALIWLIGAYAISTGAMFLVLAWRLRQRARPGAVPVDQRVTPDRRISPAHS